MASDVLKEQEAGQSLANNSSDVRPKVSRIMFSTALAGETEGLTRVSANEDIHDSTPRAAVEGPKVGPDRSVR
jgi:hypothetical protein